MREQPERGYFKNDKGRVVHGRVDWCRDKGLQEITKEEADSISARDKDDAQ